MRDQFVDKIAHLHSEAVARDITFKIARSYDMPVGTNRIAGFAHTAFALGSVGDYQAGMKISLREYIKKEIQLLLSEGSSISKYHVFIISLKKNTYHEADGPSIGSIISEIENFVSRDEVDDI